MDPGFPVRPLPGYAKWVARSGWIVFIGFSLSAYYQTIIWFILSGIAYIFFIKSIVCTITCPHCKRNLVPPREVDEEGQGDKVLYYDCPNCQISWRSDLVNKESDEGGG
ncbi:MAG: hypothetical protein HQM08_28550 [Candidatus Riflebacteria bacterium]|nr:hypothetical protein [Candidatus Riflebacteria bacterium]